MNYLSRTVFAGVVISLLAIGDPASAQTRTTATATSSQATTSATTTPSSRPQMVTPLRFNQEDFKKSVAAERARLATEIRTMDDGRVLLPTQAQQRVVNRLRTVYGNIITRIGRLSSADAKLSTRINEATAKGVNTSATITLFLNAQNKLSNVRSDTEAAKNEALQQATTTTSKEILHFLVEPLEGDIKSTAEAYKSVLQSLENVYPSSRPATNTNPVAR